MEYAESFGMDFGILDVARAMDREDAVGTATAALFLAANVVSTGRRSAAKGLEKLAGEQLAKRFNVIHGSTITPYKAMADWVAISKTGTRAIAMEVFTGTNKSISKVKEQLDNAISYLHSRNITNVTLCYGG